MLFQPSKGLKPFEGFVLCKVKIIQFMLHGKTWS